MTPSAFLMMELSAEDRLAVLLRYFENKPLSDVGLAFGVSADAAQKRVARAVDRLRRLLNRRSVQVTGGLLVSLLSTQVVRAAPTAVLHGVLTHSLTVATAVTSSTITTFNLFNLMTWTKAKITLALGVVALVTAPIIVQQKTIKDQRAENGVLNQSLAAARIGHAAEMAKLRSQMEELSSREDSRTEVLALRRELARLRDAIDATEGPDSHAAAALQTNAETGTVDNIPEDIMALRRLVLDPGRPVEDRLRALEKLRDADARDSEIVEAMVELALATEDPLVRAEVFRQLRGATGDSLKSALIHSVGKDDSPKVRSEAVAGLENFLDDDNVRAWLQYVARNDQVLDVAGRASYLLLAKGNLGAPELEAVLTDAGASSVELLVAAKTLRWGGPTKSQADAFARVLLESDNAKLREEAAEQLSRHYSGFAGVPETLRHAAAMDDDGRVRREASQIVAP